MVGRSADGKTEAVATIISANPVAIRLFVVMTLDTMFRNLVFPEAIELRIAGEGLLRIRRPDRSSLNLARRRSRR
jgi:hypothetical protein